MKLQDLLGTLSNLKNEVETMISKNSRISEAQKSVQDFVKTTEAELKNIVEKDLPKLLEKFNKERASLEKTVEKTISAEVKKAQNFVGSHKKDLEGLQRKIEKMLLDKGIHLPAGLKSKSGQKATKKAPAAKKKATKKSTHKSPSTPMAKKDHQIHVEKTKISKRPTRKVTAR